MLELFRVGSLKSFGVGKVRRVALVFLLVLLLVLSAGCVGHTPTGTSSKTPTGTHGISVHRTYSREELAEHLEKVRRFSYRENMSIILNLTVLRNNLTEHNNMNLIYKKGGYVDLVKRMAEVNTTIVTFPGGASTFTREVVAGGEVYLLVGGHWVRLSNETLGVSSKRVANLTWEYNVVTLAIKYLKRDPINESMENGTQVIYYRLGQKDLLEVAGAFLGPNRVSLNVSNGILELRFRNGQFVGGRMGYSLEALVRLEGGDRDLYIREGGHVYDEFIVFDINVEKQVEIPQSYVS